ncbi:citrate/2-methylcitrate synthase [Bosea sp. 2YAB26]|uniref:citrate/2-methylcitrate synthase n=1 Tax=Bosea sp. 2YAB26 TaxID=3237478 RepID=UPI003F8FA217
MSRPRSNRGWRSGRRYRGSGTRSIPKGIPGRGGCCRPSLFPPNTRRFVASRKRSPATFRLDFALTALASTLGLPQDAPFQIFAAARCTGWIAHALEQFQTGRLIRPRARYVGVAPGSA